MKVSISYLLTTVSTLARVVSAQANQAAGGAGEPGAGAPAAAATATPATGASTGGATGFSDLVGTWTSKSKKVHTGPDFYNPVDDQFIEPDLPGISYSFTADGWYEEAYFRAQANPTDPKCPKGVMQWQHGKFTKHSNGSLTMNPIKVDGRQLVSDPCRYKEGAYTRYHQWELFERYEVVIDDFHNVKRLNMYEFDGKPLVPLYLAYSPPQMLPTQTLNPTATFSASGSQAAATGTSNRKRSLSDTHLEKLLSPAGSKWLDPDRWWWFGIICTSMGTVAYVFF